MDFFRLLQSLEELLYEVMTWLLFYPRTMWRVLRRPIAMLRYSEHEQGDTPDQQYTDTMSPPLFLMVTIVLSHLLELASHQHLPKAAGVIGAQVVDSEQNLLIMRSILFAIYPLLFATARLRREHKPVTRDTLRRPFYAQCFIAAPAAFAIGVGTILGRAVHAELQIGGLILSLVAAGWFLWVETRWFKIHARLSTRAAFWLAFKTWAMAAVLIAVLGAFVIAT